MHCCWNYSTALMIELIFTESKLNRTRFKTCFGNVLHFLFWNYYIALEIFCTLCKIFVSNFVNYKLCGARFKWYYTMIYGTITLMDRKNKTFICLCNDCNKRSLKLYQGISNVKGYVKKKLLRKMKSIC